GRAARVEHRAAPRRRDAVRGRTARRTPTADRAVAAAGRAAPSTLDGDGEPAHPSARRAPVPAPPAGAAAPRRPGPRPESRSNAMSVNATVEALDANRWPDLARVPQTRARAAIAGAVVRRAAARLPLRMELPDGTSLGRPGDVPAMRIHKPKAF